MPLLNKQKFNKNPIPKDLDPEQEVFYSKLTQEIFLDYEEFFERTILCNSLVWTCALTGKTGLTYAEALESEQKARKSMSSFPFLLEKAIVYLISLTKRGNIKDLIDDLFGYSKDRFFIGEILQITGQKNQTCKIIDVLIPQSALMEQQQQQASSSFDEPIDVEMDQSNHSNGKKSQTNGLLIDPAKIKYLVEIESKLNGQSTRQTLKSNQLSRTKNLLTKDKIYIIIKTNCDALHSIWTLTERAKSRFNLNQIHFTDLFKGDPPCFETTYGRGQFSRNSLNNSRNSSLNTSKHNKSSTNGSSPSKKQQQITKYINDSKNTSVNDKSSSKPSINNNNSNNNNNSSKKKSTSTNSQKVQTLSKLFNKKVCDMTTDEFIMWRSHKNDEDFKELEQIESEADKLFKKEEREKEKERLKQEKNKQKEYLKELKKPKEDLECENLNDLPKATPIQSKITQEMFADAIMILEFLNYFGELFEIKEDFPTGFNFELLENALFSKSCDSALCNLLLFYLDSVFKCYDEETFDTEAANADGETEVKDDHDMDMSDDDEGVSLDQLYKDPVKSVNDRESYSSLAENYSKLIKSIQGRSFKSIGLDVYTISEMLRLYFLTSGSSHHSKTKFWYQQRGGYTRMDEMGIDFSLNEKHILKKLETMNVYELEPEDKLKILSNLCHQLMSQVRFRDLLEDNWQKLAQLKAQLRDLQTEENRRLREETSERWKKKMQDKAKEKTRLEEIKTNVQQSRSAENAKLLDDIETAKQLQYSNKKRDEFIKKEKHILDEINQCQSKCCMSSLGKDRYYRRYWVLKSMPGIFVEDDNDYEQISSILANECDAFSEINNKSDIPIKTESTENINGKENKPQINGISNGLQSLNSKASNQNGLKKPCDYAKNETKWSFYCTQSNIELLIESLNERGLRESELKQNLFDLKEKIFENLNKPIIIKSLTLSKEEIETGIQNTLRENINNVLTNLFNHSNTINQKTKRQALKLATTALSSTTNFTSISSKEYLEMDLRGKLLDIAEQMSCGGLGSLKVIDRLKWKEALEKKGSYDPQCTTLSWGGDTTRPVDEITIDVNAYSDCVYKYSIDSQPESIEQSLKTVNSLAKAMLQIEQAVEKRFLRNPLGDNAKTPEKQRRKPANKQPNGGLANHDEESNDSSSATNSILHNWEKSLMNCTTLSQLFIHLQSLDESIAWSKSVLNAKCRVCKRKCDAEKMLLCDKCDRGHHLYCLRPALKQIPEGEWFCPECKPRDVEKSPRKIRKSFPNHNEVYSDENEEEEENGEDEEDDQNEQEDEDEQEEEEQDEEEEEVEEEDEETSNDNSDDSNAVTKTRAKQKQRASRASRRKKDETEDENEDDEEEEDNQEQDDDDEANEEEIEEEADEANENEESNSQDEEKENEEEDEENNDDDEDFVHNTKNKNKIKLNGTHFKKKKNVTISDDEINIDEDSAEDESSSRRLGRKRKLTANNSTKKETAISKVAIDSKTGRSSRSRLKPDYHEMSEDISGTDEDSKMIYHNKRIKMQSKPVMTNDTSSRNTELAHRLKVIEKLLNDMMKHTDGWPFLKPVSKRDAPNYHEVIKKPMDFATIKNNINNFKYDDYTNIIDDIRLTFENCWKYNEPGSDIYKTGKRLSTYFENHAKQAGLLDYKQIDK